MSLLRNILRETVFMRLLLAFTTGIIVYELSNEKLSVFIIIGLFALLFSVFLVFIFKINTYNFTFNFFNGLLVFCICSLSAFQLSYFQDYRNHRAYKALLDLKSMKVEVLSNGRLTKSNCIYDVKIISEKCTSAYTILSIKTGEINYKFGDTLKVEASLQPIDFISHPAQFNYKRYLSLKHIHHKLQTSKEEVKLISHAKSFSILAISNDCRSRLLNILKSNIKDEGSYEMSAALLLGERSDLDKNLLKSYSDTGTIHIISVSGLHVGIIFIVLQFILKHIPFLKNEIMKCLIVLVCIWFYSTLTGLPASVIRSALMISFHSVGKAISSKSNSINHVAASAILLLSINTNYLFDIGFQLSYLAVLGIMYLQKPISDLYLPKSKLGNYIWLTTSVSLAAQLFTLPLCWYYFHQFPNYFIIANLIAIPLSSVALYASIANLALSSVPLLSKLSEWALIYSIKWLNNYLSWISSWPFAVSKLERIDLFQCLCYCLILFFMILYRKEKIRIALQCCIVMCIISTSYSIVIQLKHQHNHLWVQKLTYQINYSIEDKNTVTHFIYKGEKQRNISQQISLWRQYSNKHQTVRFIETKNFELLINGTEYSNKPIKEQKLGNNYHKICLK